MIRSIAEAKALNAATDHHFFDRDAMAFFRSHISDTIHPVPNGALFVTSEQNRHSDGTTEPRRYTVRFIHDSGCVDKVGDFQRWPSRKVAQRMARLLAEVWTAETFIGVYRTVDTDEEVPVIVTTEHQNPSGTPTNIMRFMYAHRPDAGQYDGGTVRLVDAKRYDQPA